MSATRMHDSIAGQAVLYMALELSEKTWKLGFTTGLGQEPRQRGIPARVVVLVEQEIAAAKERFGLPHHVTQRGNRRQQTFFGHDDYATYIELRPTSS